MTRLTFVLRYAKAHIALVGSLLVWYAAHYPKGPDAHWVALAIAVLTAAGVLKVPNLAKAHPAGTKVTIVHHGNGKTHTVVRRHIPETKVPGKPLGRHIHHDSRSLDYLVPKMSRRAQRKMTAVRWPRMIDTLNQGDVGACTGNATVGNLGTVPFFATLVTLIAKGLKLDEPEALTIYSAAEVLDGNGPYPPNDDGSSGLSVAKVAKTLGLISAYLHITSLAAAKTAITTGPFITGTNWMTGMDAINAAGLVTATGTVRGAHEYECVGFDPVADLWEFVNSWGDWGVTVDGQPGHFYMSSADYTKLLAAQGDATVFTPLAVAPAPTPAPDPAPTGGVLITDPTVVAKLTELAGKKHEDVDDFTTGRLKSLYNLD